MSKQPVRVTVNGKPREGFAEPRRTLADFLRENLQLTGTHLGCEHGVCGAFPPMSLKRSAPETRKPRNSAGRHSIAECARHRRGS